MLVPRFSATDPEWLAHRHVEEGDAIRFIHVPRDDRTRVPFLTDPNLGDRPAAPDVAIAKLLEDQPKSPLRWVFHSAFCGSTLLAHAFDLPGISSSLSEPVLINDVVGMRRRGADPRRVARTADVALRVLGRPYAGEQAVVIKPSNVANPLAELLLALAPESRAIFLYAPLETFLVSVARKGLGCRLWVRELLEGYLREGFVALGFEPEEYFRQSDLQVAAVGWLAQHAHFARLADKLGPQRLATLDADLLVAKPREAIAAVARHFQFGLEAAATDAVANGPAFARHSKSGAAYSLAAREADYAAARGAYGEEIDVVIAWAQEVAARAGVDLNLPNDVFDQA